jgi:hypothetical protein
MNVFEFTFSDGKKIRSTLEHRYITASKEWKPIQEIFSIVHRNNKIIWKENKILVNGKEMLTKEWLEQKRLKETLTAKEIASQSNTTIDIVKHKLRDFAIKLSAEAKKTLTSFPKRAIPWNKGLRYKNPKISQSPGYINRKIPRGKDHPNWKGGIVREDRKWLLGVSEQIYKKYNYMCAICSSKDQGLNAHHVDPVWHNKERSMDITNLICLCKKCHSRIHSYHLELILLEEFNNHLIDSKFFLRNGRQEYTTTFKKKHPKHTIVAKEVSLSNVEYIGKRQCYDIEIDGKYSNFIANGIIVHNSRSASSGRAVPGKKYREQLSGYVPEVFPRNGKGMQPKSNLDPFGNWVAIKTWMLAYYIMCGFQWFFINILKVHKEIANRLLDCFAWVNVITTTTKIQNFLILRTDTDAQFQIRELANGIKEAIDSHMIRKSHIHLPFITSKEIYEVCFSMKRMDLQDIITKIIYQNCTDFKIYKKIPLDIYMALIMMNTSMTAKGSYLNHFQPESLEGHVNRYKSLVQTKPIHASPAESCAMSFEMYKYLYNRDLKGTYNIKGLKPLDKYFAVTGQYVNMSIDQYEKIEGLLAPQSV